MSISANAADRGPWTDRGPNDARELFGRSCEKLSYFGNQSGRCARPKLHEPHTTTENRSRRLPPLSPRSAWTPPLPASSQRPASLADVRPSI